MPLATAEIDCTVSPPLSAAMEDCSIVRGPQLQRLCPQNCCMSGQRRMFGSLWSVVVVHEHRRQDGSRRLSTSAKCQTATNDGRTWPPWSRRAGVPVASVADVQCACLRPSFHRYSVHLPTEGWPGWVGLCGWLHAEMVYPPADGQWLVNQKNEQVIVNVLCVQWILWLTSIALLFL